MTVVAGVVRDGVLVGVGTGLLTDMEAGETQTGNVVRHRIDRGD